MASRKPKAQIHILMLPGKQLARRFSVLMLLAAGLMILMLDRAGNEATMRFRTHVSDTLTPALSALASPVNAVQSAGIWIGEMAALRQENIQLKNQNLQLLKWQAAGAELEKENRALRDMLHVVPMQRRNYITARMVSDIGGPYVHAALINAGAKAGIQSDQAVITESGLIGRIVEAGESSARVLLITDMNSRVPVVTERSQEKSILTGAGHALPVMSYLTAGSKVMEGERVVTSGDGGIFPPGIPVGVVVSHEGAVRVQPFVNPAKATFVSAVDYQF